MLTTHWRDRWSKKNRLRGRFRVAAKQRALKSVEVAIGDVRQDRKCRESFCNVCLPPVLVPRIDLSHEYRGLLRICWSRPRTLLNIEVVRLRHKFYSLSAPFQKCLPFIPKCNTKAKSCVGWCMRLLVAHRNHAQQWENNHGSQIGLRHCLTGSGSVKDAGASSSGRCDNGIT